MGGRNFTTTHQTLMTHPHSKLAKIVSGREFHEMPDGSLCIDRDGTVFDEVLFYLQYGKCCPYSNLDKKHSSTYDGLLLKR